ncbi:MAG: SusC/RagA family TonB-linked outer membrane protein [Tannerellaceae bacterium]|nr:SusC/RagA family TonB-linked outer membrane protein [Tannerellaceae bacterium]
MVRGTVVDEADEAVVGAAILVDGTTMGTITDLDGKFQIDVPPSATTFTVRYLGMKDLTLPIKDGIKILMATSVQELEEIVVQVAYGESKKKALTGAVSAIDAKSIEIRPVTAVTSALEGIRGVQVNSTYGQPGSSPSIRIRGFSSVNGSNDPLFVIDGVPFGGNMSDLNAQDIESLSVLKDASAAALYGNRAANGVVLITTKNSKSEKPKITLIVNQGIYQRGIPEYEKLGTNDWMEMMFRGYRNNLMTSSPDKYPDFATANEATRQQLIPNTIGYNIYNKGDRELFDANGKLAPDAKIHDAIAEDLDWWKAGLRNGHRQEYTLSGEGGNNKANYYFSAGYLDENGYVVNSGFERFSGMAKMNITPNKWFKTGFTLRGSSQKTLNTNGEGGGFTNLFAYARSMAPVYPVHLHDLTTGAYVLDAAGNKQYDSGIENGRLQNGNRHVIWENELNSDITTRMTLQSNLFAEVTFLNDFKFRVNGDLNVRNDENDTYENAIIGDGKGNGGRAGSTDYRYREYTFQEQLTWNRLFNDIHHVGVLLAHENYAYNRVYSSARKAMEIFPGRPDMVNFTSLTSINGYTDNYRLESYLGRISYDFDEKYYLDLSFRRDGSSRFYKDSRWGNFYSVGGNWIVTKERFMDRLREQVNFLKLRANYGEVGNDGSVGRYGYMSLYSIGQNGGKGAAYKTQLEAKKIRWEAVTAFGLALEGRVLDRVDFSVEYFDKRSKGLLFNVYLPLSAGATSDYAEATITRNLGTVSNRGWEVGVDVDILKNRNWRWNAGIDATFYKNKVLRLPEQNREKGIINGTKKIVEGRSIYDFWTYQWVGTDQMTGRSLYALDDEKYYVGGRNAKETRTLIEDQKDYVVINGVAYTHKTTYAKRDWSGSAIPTVAGNFHTGLDYRNWSLNLLFTYSLGAKMMESNYQGYLQMSGTPNALHKDLLDSWETPPAGMTETSADRISKDVVPQFNTAYYADHNATSTRFLKNASFLVLKNIHLSYALPKELIRKVDLSSVRLNLTCENLFTLTTLKGMNPQARFNGTTGDILTTPRIFSVGLNVQF